MSRRHAPATARNRDAILAVLKRVLPAQGKVLEIASGTGEHVVHFAAALPGLTFQPSDLDEAALGSIAAWIAEAGLNNVQPPLRLDATQDAWPDTVDAIFSANMIHIAPWEAALGLFRGAGRALRSGGVLVIYGPFRMGGAHTAPSNQAFDEELRARDPRWGVRDLEMLQAVAAEHGLALEERVPMPANNQTLIFRRT
jgi:cyclopropane fatty-acyl-phospholipid synthase-like methyltransferase